MSETNEVQRSEVEGIKEASRALRGTLAQTLATPAGHFDDAESTLVKIVDEFGILEKELNQATARTSRGTALVVEDDRNECELLAGFLRLSGFDVTAVSDGADALGWQVELSADLELVRAA